MKNIIFIIILFCLLSFKSEDSKVFICGVKGAKKYHFDENCRGLNNCKHDIKKVPISEAKGYGLTICGWED